jgi:hypothetical protein
MQNETLQRPLYHRARVGMSESARQGAEASDSRGCTDIGLYENGREHRFPLRSIKMESL